MEKSRDLVIIGASAFAEVACAYFTHDSSYRVRGFAVERAYLKEDRLCGLPVVALDEVAERFPAATHDAYVAIVYSELNRLRARLMGEARRQGYRLASFISSAARVWPNVVLGEHCFIFEDNVVQPFVRIGANVVLWSGNHIGHHSAIADNVFIASHVVVSGFCSIGANSFLGVNAAIANNVAIGADNWIGPGVTITADTPPGSLFRAPEPTLSKVGTARFFRLKS